MNYLVLFQIVTFVVGILLVALGLIALIKADKVVEFIFKKKGICRTSTIYDLGGAMFAAEFVIFLGGVIALLPPILGIFPK